MFFFINFNFQYPTKNVYKVGTIEKIEEKQMCKVFKNREGQSPKHNVWRQVPHYEIYRLLFALYPLFEYVKRSDPIPF